MTIQNIYTRAADEGGLEVGVGAMLLNIADATPGHERAYNRWYEDDHLPVGGLMAPWVFAARRWIAPPALQRLQYARPGGEFDPPGAGAFMGLCWIAPGHLPDYLAWTAGIGPRTDAAGRSFAERRLVFTSFAEKVASIRRDDAVPTDTYALHDPSPGAVVQLIDVDDPADREDFARWLENDLLPAVQARSGGAVARTMVFRGASETTGMRESLRDLQRRSDNDGRRLVLVWFLDVAAQECWEDVFRPLSAEIEATGRAAVEWMAPYLPARMGTDLHIDSLEA